MQKDISIIIVNTNSLEYVKKCLPTISSDNSRNNFEIIVVDNNSADGSEAYLREHFPEVKVVQSHANLGFTRGNNLGYLHSSGRYLLFLNGDTEVYGDAVQKLADTLDGYENSGIVGARLLNTDGSLQKDCIQAFPTILNRFLDSELLQRGFPKSRLWGQDALWRAENPIPVEMVSGACLMIKRDVFEAIGMWDVNYFIFSEDVDLCYKTRRAGRDVLYQKEAVVLHHGGGSTYRKGQSRFSDVLQRESLFTFMKKYHGGAYAFLFRASVCFSALLRMAVLKLMMALGLDFIENGGGALVRWRWLLRWSLGYEKWAAELNKPSKMTQARWEYVRALLSR